MVRKCLITILELFLQFLCACIQLISLLFRQFALGYICQQTEICFELLLEYSCRFQSIISIALFSHCFYESRNTCQVLTNSQQKECMSNFYIVIHHNHKYLIFLPNLHTIVAKQCDLSKFELEFFRILLCLEQFQITKITVMKIIRLSLHPILVYT